jgi:hypothetical protein
MIYRGPGFLADDNPAPRHAATPPSPVRSLTGDTQKGWERETTSYRERGGSGGRLTESYDHTRKFGPLKNIQYSLVLVQLTALLRAILFR